MCLSASDVNVWCLHAFKGIVNINGSAVDCQHPVSGKNQLAFAENFLTIFSLPVASVFFVVPVPAVHILAAKYQTLRGGLVDSVQARADSILGGK